jgi:hypothetical protein
MVPSVVRVVRYIDRHVSAQQSAVIFLVTLCAALLTTALATVFH